MADATLVLPTPAPLVRQSGTDHLRNAGAINAVLRGRISASLLVTLAADATTSVVYDSRISATSFVGLMPQSATAATALAAGLYVVPGAGQATIHHADTADSDKTFAAVILG
jgi:hypothetical protein